MGKRKIKNEFKYVERTKIVKFESKEKRTRLEKLAWGGWSLKRVSGLLVEGSTAGQNKMPKCELNLIWQNEKKKNIQDTVNK
jgi:hypothetical protein